MADPLSVTRGPIPTLVDANNGGSRETATLRQLWEDVFHAPGNTNLQKLKAKGLKGEIMVGERPTLRWIHWILYLSDHLSSTPSSWTAVLDKDRSHYAHLRRTMLRAPDGNYPPGVGLEDDEQVAQSMTRSRFSQKLAARPPNSMASSGMGHAADRSVIGDLSVNNPLSLDDSNPWKTHYASLELRQLIAQDVERTFPDIPFFREAKVQKGLTNALFVWCKQKEDVGYRQGMHELMAVLWIVRHRDSINGNRQAPSASAEEQVMRTVLGDRWIEHDVFTLFCVLMQSAKSWFEWRPSPLSAPVGTGLPQGQGPNPSSAVTVTPIIAKCEGIRDLLHTTDPSLAQHLDSLGIEPQLYALRWIRLIFTREFPLDDALKIWDGLFATDKSLALTDQTCVAMLLRVRNQLLSADYTTALQTLLRYQLDPAAMGGSNRTELLVQQAAYLRDNGSTPSAGVTVVMQNRDLLGIAPLQHSAREGSGSSSQVSTLPSPGSPTAQYKPPYQPRGPPKFATVGRATSGANLFASWQRPDNSPARQPLPPQPRLLGNPLSANGSAGAQNPANRPFNITPSAYLPEGISDFARGLYERSDSLGINRALSSTMVNVQRTVTAAAAGVAASASGPGTTGSGGFPSSFGQALPSSSVNATAAAPAPGFPTLGLQPRHHQQISATLGRSSGAQLANIDKVTKFGAVAELTAKLEGLTSTNKAISAAVSACVEVLEGAWLAAREDQGARDRSQDLEQGDVDSLMSFTALKHIRDVLNGTAKEFDPATLPGRSGQNTPSAVPAALPSPPVPSPRTSSRPTTVDTKHTRFATANGDVAPRRLPESAQVSTKAYPLPMSLPEYLRYGRQMILSDFGLEGQLRLRKSKVLVVGAGGLGCPAIQYLAAAGVGQISILDHDTVEPSNLARQILHTDAKVGMNKAESAAQAARVINPYIKLAPHAVGISSFNARSMIAGHDLVLDCTDNPLTRYLISDAAVLEGVELVSGAAQGYDGQLIVLHKKIKREFGGPKQAECTDVRGPCYRCLFPVAPKPEDVTDCEDGGVLGGITGLVGTMQALESVKILAKAGEDTPPLMTLTSPMSSTPFRTIKLRPRRISTCRSCGDPNQVGKQEVITDLEKEDYISFCGLNRPERADRTPYERVQAKELDQGRLIIDIRPPVEFGITHIDGSTNLPFAQIRKDPRRALQEVRTQAERSSKPLLLVCRKGNDSQLAVHLLTQEQAPPGVVDPLLAEERRPPIEFTDLVGGLRAYASDKDPSFPIY